MWSKAANGRDGYWSTNLGQVPAPICLYTLSKSVWGIFYRADSFYRNSLKAELVGGRVVLELKVFASRVNKTRGRPNQIVLDGNDVPVNPLQVRPSAAIWS